MVERYDYSAHSEKWASAPLRRAFDITPSSTDLAIPTRAITVSVDATITGILVGDDSSHTTHTLNAGTLYPFAFKKITSISVGSVKGYA